METAQSKTPAPRACFDCDNPAMVQKHIPRVRELPAYIDYRCPRCGYFIIVAQFP